MIGPDSGIFSHYQHTPGVCLSTYTMCMLIVCRFVLSECFQVNVRFTIYILQPRKHMAHIHLGFV